MSSIVIRTHIDSENLYLSALKAMIGKDVQITVQEADSHPQCEAESKDYSPLKDIAGRVAIDPEAYKELRAAEMI